MVHSSIQLSFNRLNTGRLNLRVPSSSRDSGAMCEIARAMAMMPDDCGFYDDPIAYADHMRRRHGQIKFYGFQRGKPEQAVVMLGVMLDRDRCLRVSYETHPDFRRQGFAAEAQGAMVETLARLYPHKSFAADIDLDNETSKHILLKSGFHITGVHKSRLPGFGDYSGVAFKRPSLAAARLRQRHAAP